MDTNTDQPTSDSTARTDTQTPVSPRPPQGGEEPSDPAACSVPCPNKKTIWKWWKLNNETGKMRRCNGTADFGSAEEAFEFPLLILRKEEEAVLLKETTIFSDASRKPRPQLNPMSESNPPPPITDSPAEARQGQLASLSCSDLLDELIEEVDEEATGARTTANIHGRSPEKIETFTTSEILHPLHRSQHFRTWIGAESEAGEADSPPEWPKSFESWENVQPPEDEAERSVDAQALASERSGD